MHYRWDTHNKPALAIASGDSVVMTTREVSDGQLTPASDSSIIQTLDWDRFYPLAGPIAVEGARPGDTLAIEIVDLAPGDWGWTAIIPGKGLLPGDFPEPYPRISDLTRCDTTAFGDAVTIPIAPFLGDGRVSGRRPRAGGDAARHVRRQPRHASARAARRFARRRMRCGR